MLFSVMNCKKESTIVRKSVKQILAGGSAGMPKIVFYMLCMP